MATRRLLVGAMANLRELGGYATTDGRSTQFGRFLRSDAPISLTQQDIDALRAYGVRTVVDLRSEEEAAARPCALARVPEIDYANIPFLYDMSLPAGTVFSPALHYVPMLRGPNRVREALTKMADADDGVVLFHCTAGKDRTGMIAALLLSLSGVPNVDIVADYQVTFTYIRQTVVPWVLANGGTLDMCRSDGEWLDPLLAYLAECGGAAACMRALGLDDARIEQLRDRLLR